MTRFSPVVLIAGAASSVGAACAQSMANEASGGLLLVDGDEAALTAAADGLKRPPERVSTLAFDIADAPRWAEAEAFVREHYGRIDWAIACVGAEQRAAAAPGAAIGVVRALAPLMRDISMGGAVTLVFSAKAVKIDALLRLVRVTAKEGEANRVRVNALLNGAIDSPLWRRDPVFEVLARDTGDEVGALMRLERMSPPLAKCSEKQDLARLARLLLGDAAGVSGVTLVADSGYAL
jgi:3-oxoacyl-[acyl-carrier protein] reductase